MPLNSHIRTLFKKAIVRRRPLYERTQALRLVNSSADGLEGFILEQYNRHFAAQLFTSRWNAQDVAALVREHFDVDYLIIKDRTRSASSKPEDMHFKAVIERAPSRCVVKEQGLLFDVDLNDTLNTGLFLDMRANRRLVADACRDKKVLNCFSYTCSFGVYAKAAGASLTVNVDVSRKVLDRGRHNYELNALSVQPTEFIKADAVSYLQRAIVKDNRFDVIILDPPSFSRGEKVFSVEKNLPALIDAASRVLTENGFLFVATNLSTLTSAKLQKMVKGNSTKKNFKRITLLGQDEDFTGSGDLKESHLAAVWVAY